ncbi:alpha/beta hydrolase [Duganella lactea]|uniref:alpha/beta hydrolase n=1 Tax=Duganella lactea TaxID=2692173 RepID=UPI001E570BFA|nr:alpha/beta fold hydrolase [Duganella lactea]
MRADRPDDPPRTQLLDAASAPGWKLDELALPSAGAALHGVAASRPGNALTVLYFGGNAFHLDQHGAEVLAAVAPCGADVTIFDYRGYGRSKGQPSIAALQQDALRIFDDVNSRHPGKVVLHGQSLGSFVAAYVAQQRPAVRGLILESTTTNARDWSNAMLPWYVWPFVRLRTSPELQGIDNVAAASAYAGPALVLVGENDGVTPPRLASKVYAALQSPARRLVLVPGAGHNDVLSNPVARPAYCQFIAEMAMR